MVSMLTKRWFWRNLNIFDAILCQLDSFHSNLRFTIDKFKDENVHFLDVSSLDRI